MAYSKERTSRYLKARMALAGMTIADLAKASGVSADTITNYTRGAAVPRLDTAIALAETLGCTVDDICGYGDVA